MFNSKPFIRVLHKLRENDCCLNFQWASESIKLITLGSMRTFTAKIKNIVTRI